MSVFILLPSWTFMIRRYLKSLILIFWKQWYIQNYVQNSAAIEGKHWLSQEVWRFLVFHCLIYEYFLSFDTVFLYFVFFPLKVITFTAHYMMGCYTIFLINLLNFELFFFFCVEKSSPTISYFVIWWNFDTLTTFLNFPKMLKTRVCLFWLVIVKYLLSLFPSVVNWISASF